MVRAFQLSILIAMACAAGEASARTTLGCEDGPMSLPVDQIRTPATASLVVADDTRPEARLCMAGATDDPSCRPFMPLVPSGPGPSLFSSELFTLARAASLPPPSTELVFRDREPRLALAPGPKSRLERPPRSR